MIEYLAIIFPLLSATVISVLWSSAFDGVPEIKPVGVIVIPLLSCGLAENVNGYRNCPLTSIPSCTELLPFCSRVIVVASVAETAFSSALAAIVERAARKTRPSRWQIDFIWPAPFEIDKAG